MDRDVAGHLVEALDFVPLSMDKRAPLGKIATKSPELLFSPTIMLINYHDASVWRLSRQLMC